MSGCRRGTACSVAPAGAAGALPDFVARYAGISQRAVRRVPQLAQRLAIGKPLDNAVSKLPQHGHPLSADRAPPTAPIARVDQKAQYMRM